MEGRPGSISRWLSEDRPGGRIARERRILKGAAARHEHSKVKAMSMALPANTRTRIACLVLTCWIAFALYTVPAISKFDALACAIVEHHTLAVDAYVPITDSFQRSGHWFVNAPPGLALFGAAIYLMVQVALSHYPMAPELHLVILHWLMFGVGLGGVCALAAGALAMLASQYCPPKRAIILGYLLVLGTFYLPFASSVAWNQSLYTALLVFSLYTIELGPPRWRPMLLGACLGASLVTDFLTVVAYPAILLYWGWSKRPARIEYLLLSLGCLPFLVVLAWYNSTAFGHWWVTGYAAQGLTGPGRPWWFSLDIKSPVTELFGLNGLFTTSPALALALPSICSRNNVRGPYSDFWSLCTCIVVLHLAFAALYTGTATEVYFYGPRFLLPTVPLLILLAARREIRWLGAWLLGLSFVLQLLAVNAGARGGGVCLRVWASSFFGGFRVPMFAWLQAAAPHLHHPLHSVSASLALVVCGLACLTLTWLALSVE